MTEEEEALFKSWDVDKLPEWKDFPWKNKLPHWITVKFVVGPPLNLLILHAPIYDLHCAFRIDSFEPETSEVFHPDFGDRVLRPMVNNLGGTVFELLYPDEFTGMLRRQIESVTKTGSKWPTEDFEKWRVRKTLEY